MLTHRKLLRLFNLSIRTAQQILAPKTRPSPCHFQSVPTKAVLQIIKLHLIKTKCRKRHQISLQSILWCI